MCAPLKISAVCVASVPYSRSSGGTSFPSCPRVRPINDFREVPASSGKPSRLQFAETPQQWVVLLETFSESEAGVEHNPFAPHSRQHCFLRPLLEFPFHQQHNVAWRRKRAPLFRAPSHVHQNRAAFEFGDRLCHSRVPAKSADVVHDLRSGSHRRASHIRFVSVHRKNCRGMFSSTPQSRAARLHSSSPLTAGVPHL